MFYIKKSNNKKPIIWNYYSASKYDNSWTSFLVFAKGFNTRQEAEDKLNELGLIENKGKVKIIERDKVNICST
jgi:hypothetical protein